MKIETLHQHFLQSTGICTDTRKITPNCLFFALKGDNFDGNTFTQQALEQGALKVVIDDIRYHKNTGETILCKDTLSLLQKLATFHRNYLEIPIIALTGSNGKTTTKELINAVLSKKFNTTATKGNLNNHIGVPLTLLSMTKETQLGIVEMGANHIKEIDTLCKIAQPNYGYITNFGRAHIEGFGSEEGVIKGKSELYNFLTNKKLPIFLNGDDPVQKKLLNGYINKFGFSQKDSTFFKITLKEASPFVTLNFNQIEVNSKLIGIYNFTNICAAIIMGHYFGVADDSTKEAIEQYTPTNNRSQLINQGTNTIILDAYNANPTSMMAALKNLEQMDKSSKILFLGDMFELGETAKKEHQAIADYVSDNKFEQVYLIGENFGNVTISSNAIQKFDSFNSLKPVLETLNISESTVLIKASRGMALERIVPLL